MGERDSETEEHELLLSDEKDDNGDQNTSFLLHTSKALNNDDEAIPSHQPDSVGDLFSAKIIINEGQDETSHTTSTEQSSHDQQHRVINLASNVTSFSKKIRQSWFIVETRALLKLALPIFLAFFFQQLLYLAVSLFVGHFSDKAMFDAAALGNSFVNVTGFSIVLGLSSAASTLCPQSYGFKNYKRVGIITQRGILIISLACLPIAVLWFNSESILLLLRQQPCVARFSGQYLRVMILALPGIVLYIMIQKYLQAQSVVWIFVAGSLIVSIVSISLCAVFVIGADLGAIGAALALVIGNSVFPLLLLIYTRVRGLHKKTWGGWSWQSLDEWGQFLKLGVPGFLMLCFEWWTYEISVLVTGTIDKTQLAVNTVLLQLLTMAFMIPLGIGIATNVRVGNELGAGHPLRAKRASYTAFVIAATSASFLTILILTTKDYIGKAFISDEEVVEETSRALYAALGVVVGDQIQAAISGALRGTGRQALAAVINFTAFYIIGLPIGICLALLADMGALGMWIGLSIAAMLQALIFTIVLFTTNWKKQCEKARKNASDSNKRAVQAVTEDSNDNVEECELSEQEQEKEDIDFDNAKADNPASAVRESFMKDKNDFDVPHGEVDIEEVPLVSHQDVEEFTEVTSPSSKESNVKRTRLRLLLTKGSVFAAAILLLVVGAVLAGVFPHGGTLESDCIVNNTCYCNDSYTEPMVLFNSSLLATSE